MKYLLLLVLAAIIFTAGWMMAALLVMLLAGDLHLDYDTVIPVMSWRAAKPIGLLSWLLLATAGGVAGHRRRD